jgi:hypothetical protein
MVWAILVLKILDERVVKGRIMEIFLTLKPYYELLAYATH